MLKEIVRKSTGRGEERGWKKKVPLRLGGEQKGSKKEAKENRRERGLLRNKDCLEGSITPLYKAQKKERKKKYWRREKKKKTEGKVGSKRDATSGLRKEVDLKDG